MIIKHAQFRFFFGWVCFAQSVVSLKCFVDCCLSFPLIFCLAIVMPSLPFMTFNYPFDILKLYLGSRYEMVNIFCSTSYTCRVTVKQHKHHFTWKSYWTPK